MAKVCFSFDDSLADTYDLAFPILKEFKMPFTVNSITKPIEEGISKFMSFEQLRECYEYGAEIACHGHTHENTRQGVLDNIESLKEHNLCDDKIGFASPRSEITSENGEDIKSLIKEGRLSYVRSGICVRREGLLYSALSYAERKTHSKWLFYILNKRNIMKSVDCTLVKSVAITKYTTVDQIMYLLDKVNSDESVILMFHHIIDGKDEVSAGIWACQRRDFYDLCERISKKREIDVVTTMEIVNK